MGDGASITAKQLAHLTITIILATAILYLPSITLVEAGNGGWLSALISIVPCMGVVVVVWVLHRNYPRQTMAQYLPHLFGRAGGKVIGAILFPSFWFVGMVVERELSQFIHNVMLPETPILAIDILIYAALAFALYCGLEGIVRVNETVYIALMAMFLIFPIALIGSFHIDSFFPLLDKGWLGVIRGAYVPGGWFTEIIVLGMFFPSVVRQKRCLTILLRYMPWIGVLMMVGMIFTISLLGASEAARLWLPTFELVKYIRWGEFLQHIDALFVIPWILAMVIKISALLYAGLLGMVQTFKLPSMNWLIIPLCITSIYFERWVFRSDVNFITFLFVVLSLYAYILQGLLLVMLAVCWKQQHRLAGDAA